MYSFLHACDNFLEFEVFFHVFLLFIHLLVMLLVLGLGLLDLFGFWDGELVSGRLEELLAAPKTLHRENL